MVRRKNLRKVGSSERTRTHPRASTASFAVDTFASFANVNNRGSGKKKKGGVGGRGKGANQKTKARATRVLAAGLAVQKPQVVDTRGLTKKDAMFVSNYLKGMPKMDAMKLAGKAIGVEMTDGAASTAAAKSLSKPEVESALIDALEQAGVTDVLIAQKLKEGLDATAFTQGGFEHDDYKTRLGYIQTITKLKGQMAPEIAAQQQVLNYTSFKGDEDANDSD